jgi:hypothetical protein
MWASARSGTTAIEVTLRLIYELTHDLILCRRLVGLGGEG